MVTFPNMIQVWKEEHEGAEINYVVNDTRDDISNGTHVPQYGTHDGTHVPQNGTHGRFRGEELDEWIAYQLAVHPKMTTEELSSLSGRGIRTIKRHIADMQRLKYIGSGANGYWLVGPKIENPKKDEQVSGQAGGQADGQAGVLLNDPIQKLIDLIGKQYLSVFEIQKAANIASRRYVREKMLVPAIWQGFVLMEYPDSPSHPKQWYYLSDKGLMLFHK